MSSSSSPSIDVPSFFNTTFFSSQPQSEETLSDLNSPSDPDDQAWPCFPGIPPNFITPPLSKPEISREDAYDKTLYQLPRKDIETTTSTSMSVNALLSKKRRGRKKKSHKTYEQHLPFKIGCHDDTNEDNMMKKIKPYYHKFLVLFINNCIRRLGVNEELKKLEGKFNSDTSIGRNQELFSSCIYEVVSQPISKKCRNFEEDHNSKVMLHLKGRDGNLDKILNLSYSCVYRELFVNKNFKNEVFEQYVTCIPRDCCIDALIKKQHKELKTKLLKFAQEKFLEKIMKGVPRKTKM